jgi:hypothetical protein
MRAIYTAVVQRDGRRWIGWIEEIVRGNSREKKRRELLNNLRSTLKEMLEINRAGAVAAMQGIPSRCEHKSVKRHKLIDLPRAHSCIFIGEGAKHACGKSRQMDAVHPFRGTDRFAITWLGGFAMTLTSPGRKAGACCLNSRGLDS